jgi:hypothetical protein
MIFAQSVKFQGVSNILHNQHLTDLAIESKFLKFELYINIFVIVNQVFSILNLKYRLVLVNHLVIYKLLQGFVRLIL